MGGAYHFGEGGMSHPDPELPKEETPRYGKCGKMRHTYLRAYKKALYTRMELLTKQIVKQQDITEQLIKLN